MEFPQYKDRFTLARLSRTDDGILTIRMTKDDGPLIWGGEDHEEYIDLFHAVAGDPGNVVVILTGTGDFFIGNPAPRWTGEQRDDVDYSVLVPDFMDQIANEATRLLYNLLSIDCPIIAAINGPATAHCEFGLLSDIVLCSEDTVFAEPHFELGLVPGDGVQILLERVLGGPFARYLMYTGEELSVQDAYARGLVSEVVPREQLLDRANELAARLASRDRFLLRNTRRALIAPMRRALAQELDHTLMLEMAATYAANAKAAEQAS